MGDGDQPRGGEQWHERLARLRAERGWSLTDAARKLTAASEDYLPSQLDSVRRQLVRWESGATGLPRAASRKMIGRAFDVDPDSLFAPPTAPTPDEPVVEAAGRQGVRERSRIAAFLLRPATIAVAFSFVVTIGNYVLTPTVAPDGSGNGGSGVAQASETPGVLPHMLGPDGESARPVLLELSHRASGYSTAPSGSIVASVREWSGQQGGRPRPPIDRLTIDAGEGKVRVIETAVDATAAAARRQVQTQRVQQIGDVRPVWRQAPASTSGWDRLQLLADVNAAGATTPVEGADALQWLARSDGLHLLGATRDRMGRPGVAVSADRSNGLRSVMVFGRSSGQVLSYELLDVDGDEDSTEPTLLSFVAFTAPEWLPSQRPPLLQAQVSGEVDLT